VRNILVKGNSKYGIVKSTLTLNQDYFKNLRAPIKHERETKNSTPKYTKTIKIFKIIGSLNAV
jgi:hypothetical protein